jgi:hypothetical protein
MQATPAHRAAGLAASTQFPVRREAVLTSQPVVIDPSAVRDGDGVAVPIACLTGSNLIHNDAPAALNGSPKRPQRYSTFRQSPQRQWFRIERHGSVTKRVGYC